MILVAGQSSYYGSVPCGGWGLVVGGFVGIALLSLPLLPILVANVPVPESAATPSAGEEFPVSSVVSPDLSREGTFDVDQRCPPCHMILPTGTMWIRRMDCNYMTLIF